MKKILLVAVGLILFSCKEEVKKENFKTAYVDTEKLMEKYQKAIDLEEKYKVKSDEMGRELDAKAKQFQRDVQSAQQQAPSKGPAWAEQKGMELRNREQQLTIEQQSILKELQDASGKEMDSLVKEMKNHIKEYGKKQGYDYVYGTGAVTTILYAKDSYDITDELIKIFNDKYAKEKDKSDKK